VITAVDSSVILDVLVDDPTWKNASLAALKRARAEGGLIVCEMTIAEISPALEPGGHSVEELLGEWEMVYVPCGREAALDAGQGFTRYLSRGGKRGRIVADFLIAAHAQHHADRLLARDDGFKWDYFGKLTLLEP
jgi:predicted nucleic acid-binding protein